MKLTMARERLADAFRAVVGAIPSRSTKAILQNVKFSAQDDKLTLTATDLDIGLRVEIPSVEVHVDGEAMIGARLGAILTNTTDPDIFIEADESTTKVKVGNAQFEIPGWPVQEFPDLPEFKSVGCSEIVARDLKALIRNTNFASDKKDSTRFALAGTLVEVEETALRFVATDSKRLSVCERPAVRQGETPKGNHILPMKALSLIEKCLTDDEEMVQVSLKPNEALFRTERVMVHTRLVEGRYPPYEQIISQTKKQADKTIALPVAAFLRKVKQAAVMTDEESQRINLAFSAGSLTLTSRGAETGSSTVEMAVEWDGNAAIAFDPKFVVDLLAKMDPAATVSMRLKDGSKPALFEAGEGWKYMVMPLAG